MSVVASAEARQTGRKHVTRQKATFLDVVDSEPAAVRMGTGAGRAVIAAAALGSGIAFLDGTVVNVALKSIGEDLDASLAQLQWITQPMGARVDLADKEAVRGLLDQDERPTSSGPESGELRH